MTYLKIIAPAIILTGCSMGSTNYGHQGQSGSYEQNQSSAYGQACHSNACTSSYSVSESEASYSGPIYDNQHYGQHTYQNTPYESQNYQGQNYHTPQQPSPHAYGTQTNNYGAQYGGQNTYEHGQAPQLRGAFGQPRRAYKYGTLGASLYDLDADIFGIQGRLGYQSANLWGAELEGFAGLSDEEDTVNGITAKADVDYTLGAFGVLRKNITPRWSGHVRAGYHYTEISGELSDSTGSVDVDIPGQDGFAYGIGTEYAISQRDFIRADYTRYEQDFGTNDSVSIAYGRKF